MSKYITCFITFLLLAPGVLVAAPSKPSVSGTVSNGQSITVTGSGFGATGPSVQVFDDFESGSNGTNVTTNGPSVGSWSAVNGGPGGIPQYSTDYKVSGSNSAKIDFSSGLRQVARYFTETSEVFFTFSQLLPTGKVVPGTSESLPNWKMWWLGGDGWPMGSDYVDIFVIDTLSESLFSVGDDTNSPTRYPPFGLYPSSNATKGAWNRKMTYLSNSTSSGVIWDAETTSAGKTIVRLSESGKVTAHSGELWTTLNIPGYARADSQSIIYIDDVYIAIGAGARARVEIGNASTYSDCTKLAITTPTSWADGSITTTVRGGSFAANETVYLYVVDSAGNVSQSSDPITFGGSGGGNTVSWGTVLIGR